jgi:signal peptidase I
MSSNAQGGPMKEFVRRRPFSALILSFLTPGLGQLYNGQLKKAVFLYVLGLVVIIILSFSGLLFSFFGMLICAAILIGYMIFVMIDASINARRIHTMRPRGYNKWYFYLLIILINAFALNPLLEEFDIPPVKAYKLPAQSMAPTLIVGDHIMVNIKYYSNKNLQRGDIAIFPCPPVPEKDYIKRVIGLPGETIEIRRNQVYINGKSLEESYIQTSGKRGDSTYKVPGSEFNPVTVPDGKLFVLGDNRDNSVDSRSFGFVDIARLKGKALYIYWAKDKEMIGKSIH